MSNFNSPILHAIGRFWLWLFGWKLIVDVPDIKKCVLIGAHHTSNWDFPFGLAMFYAAKLKLSWMGKHSLFKPPIGFIMKALGGIAIDRNSQHGMVKQMVQQFKIRDELIIGIAANGTRKKTRYWKSGFYWIAKEANVPIICSYLDYKKKIACVGLVIKPTGDVKKDMEVIRAFYDGVDGKRPENGDSIRLKEEGF